MLYIPVVEDKSFFWWLNANLLEIDFVDLKFCLKDPRRQYSASQEVLKNRKATATC